MFIIAYSARYTGVFFVFNDEFFVHTEELSYFNIMCPMFYIVGAKILKRMILCICVV